MFTLRAVTGKAAYALSCLLATVLLVVAGYAYKVDSYVTGLGGGIQLPGSPSTGAMNILLMGLESRTDYLGQELDHHLQYVMHVGSQGGEATNTLILIHIFAGGQRAVGFSIPRDDWVTYPKPYDGQSQGKIDQAYGLAYAQSLNETVSSSMSRSGRYHLANQAGQTAEIATVQSVTGQRVQHFAEVNLAGFYYLAQSFGGIEVCEKPWTAGNDANLADENSGWDAVADGYKVKKGGDQYLHLPAAQALAFVRDRDSLPNFDLDRTHRQQAVLDYVLWKLKNQGILSDFGQVTALLSTAKRYTITDAGWNLLDFATQMHALTGQNMKFYTAKISGYGVMDKQDVNLIDVPAVQAQIKAKFTARTPAARKKSTSRSKPAKKARPIPAASTVTVDVDNGGSTPELATSVSQALVAKGYQAGLVGNATAQQHVGSGAQVLYGAGASANAAKIAKWFGATAKRLSSLTAGHVEVLLGTGSTAVPAALAPASSAAATPSAGPTTAGQASAGDNGAAGSAVTVKAKARYGIPCVY